MGMRFLVQRLMPHVIAEREGLRGAPARTSREFGDVERLTAELRQLHSGLLGDAGRPSTRNCDACSTACMRW
jgi:hypothetical protein